ncbi:MAG: hypothetical protein ORN24_07165, partial [Burkholderiales bacterium]|nr:hypothetical protein [Burkholderiales bacterium]
IQTFNLKNLTNKKFHTTKTTIIFLLNLRWADSVAPKFTWYETSTVAGAADNFKKPLLNFIFSAIITD